jgi:Ser/Thr protein kinase RdoA (MazF antagonist)
LNVNVAPAQSRALSEVPYADLTPEVVLDALDAVGLRGDGRLIQLNSYENRVFQVFLEDGRVLVAKFYRPGRWSDAQILEEHAFTTELVEHEIPVAPVLRLLVDGESRLAPQVTVVGTTLAQLATLSCTHRFSVSERLKGRAPELEDASTLEWLGRFIGRIHVVGAVASFEHRLTLDVQIFGHAHRDWLLAQQIIPLDGRGV